jgi:transcriptional regulator with XRE-family HTH domain
MSPEDAEHSHPSTHRWNIGEAIRRTRNQKGLTLRALSEATKRADPERQGVLAAQISRIENRVVPDLREVLLLAEALGLSVEELLRANRKPWFVIRHKHAQQLLSDVAAHKVQSRRLHERHKHMMDKELYRYVPLEEEFALEGDWEGDLKPGMRAYLFEVERADRDEVIKGLDSHPGEEIVLVLEGELEFWYKQSADDPPKSISLKTQDLIHYSSELLHGYRAGGKGQTAKAIFIFAEPQLPTPEQAEVNTPDNERGSI